MALLTMPSFTIKRLVISGGYLTLTTEHEQLSDERCVALLNVLREVDYRLQWGQVHEARLLIQHQLGDDEDGKESELGHD
jgi:hypothetical protein